MADRPRHETLEIAIDASTGGVRVDRLVRRLVPAMPLAHVHAMIRTGRARGPGGRLKANDRLASGDVLELALSPADAAVVRDALAARPSGAASGESAVPIIYRDDDLVVFDKPSGIAAHPGSSHAERDTVLGALRAVAGTPANAPFKPGLVGRLDRDTSGVQLAGLNPRTLRDLADQVRRGAIRKTYLALVRNRHLTEPGRIDAPLLDAGSGARRMRAVAPGSEARALRAVTTYTIRERSDECALVEVTLETGRQHQIRAHFSSIGACLAGDVRYGDAAWNRELARTTGLRRLFLHCESAQFLHPVTKAPLLIRSDLPRELSDAVRSAFPRAERRQAEG